MEWGVESFKWLKETFSHVVHSDGLHFALSTTFISSQHLPNPHLRPVRGGSTKILRIVSHPPQPRANDGAPIGAHSMLCHSATRVVCQEGLRGCPWRTLQRRITTPSSFTLRQDSQDNRLAASHEQRTRAAQAR
jgi:hypothetical protein